MESEWPITMLGDFVEVKTGLPFKSGQFLDQGEGYKLLRGDNIVQGSFRWNNVKLWPREELTDKQQGYFLDEGDVILAMDRPWIEAGLKTGQITQHDLPCLLVQRVARLKSIDPDDQNFLKYLISSYWFVEYIKLVQTGTAVPHISAKQIQNYEFRKPPKADRLKIGHLMRSLDDKIQLNRQTNQTLEQMAQALFKSWFVDFDPVIDNALAAGNAIPEPLQARAAKRAAQLGNSQTNNNTFSTDGSPQTTAQHSVLPNNVRGLFPSEFEHNDELGWVPKGWEVKSLADVTIELRRGISPKYSEEKGIRVINQKCIRHHEVNFSLCRLNDPALRKINGRELKIGDVLVNSTGVGTLGRVAPVKYLDETTVVDSHVTIVRSNPDIYPKFVFAQLMIAKEWVIEALGEGSTGQTELSRKILSEQELLCPKVELLKSVDHFFKGLSNKSVANTKQVKELEKLRDTLLPKLISGELRLPESMASTEPASKAASA